MTLLEFITDLQSKGLTDKEVFDQAQEFKKSQATEEVVEESTEEEEVVVEETVEEVEEGNSNDSPPTGADVDQTVVAPEETEVTESISEDGSLVSEKTKADVVIPVREEIEIIENASELDYRSLFLDETMKVSMREYERAGMDMSSKIMQQKSGNQMVTVNKGDFLSLNRDNNPDFEEALYMVKEGAAAKVNTEGIRQTAEEGYFGIKGLKKPLNPGGSTATDQPYVTLSSTEANALGIKDVRGRVPNPKNKSQQFLYSDYLKSTLGERHDDYIKYQANPNEFEFPKEILDASAKAEEAKHLQNYFREKNDSTLQATIKPFIDAQIKGEKLKLEAAKKYEETLTEVLKVKGANIEQGYKDLNAKSKPYIENINKSLTAFKEAGYEDGLSDEQLQNRFIRKKYNTLVDSYTAAQTAYETQEFDGQYNLLEAEQTEFKGLVDNFNKGLKDLPFDGTDLEKAEMQAKALNFDYSLSARAGNALENFFIGGAANVASLVGQGFLHLAKGISTNPITDYKLSKMIGSMEQNITNYNVRMSEKTDATIPPPLKADDIQGAGGTLRYIGEALADNGPSILTTFLPLGAALAGGLKVAGAAGKGFAAMKAAAQAQKTYALFAMRSSQAIFFTGESGGKYGEIQVAEDKALKALPKLQERYNSMVVGKNGITQEDKNQLADEIADNKRMSSYGFVNKAFTSFGYGGTAALAETFGSLKFVTGGAQLAKNYGKVVAKKTAYESMGKYRLQLAKTYIKGMAPLVTKAAPTEVLEEGLTQIGHNSFDIIALGDDKSMFEGLDKDFLLKTAITSFAIGGPTTMQGTVNLLKNEVRTKADVDANKIKVNELLNIEARKQPGKPLSKLDQQRKTELIQELAFDDALTTQKMAHLSVDQIEEVGEINRQLRSYKSQMRGLGTTGDVASADSKQAQKLIQDKAAALDAKKQDILGTKDKTMAEKALELKTRFGSQSAIDVQKYLGLNDFANDAAMVLSAKGKKYVKIENVNGGYPTLSDIKSQLKEGGFSDTEIESLAPRLAVDETGTGKPTNGLAINGDIIVNQAAIDVRIQNSVDSSDAAYAAVAPLEELFHADLRDKKVVDKNGELGKDTTAAIDEAMEAIEAAKELGNINEKDYNGLKERFEEYKNKDGSYDMEEIMAQINNAMILGAINKSDFTNMNSTKAMLNGMVGKVLGDNAWMLNVKTGSDMFNMLDKFQDRVANKDAAQGLGDDDEVQETEALGKSKKPEEDFKESKGSAISADQTLINETTLEQLKDPNISESQRNRLTKVIVENNSGLFLGGGQYGVNFDANFKDFKNKSGDVITRQEVLNEVSTKLPNIINAYDVKGKGNFGTYAGASLKFKIPEIREAIIGAKDKAKRKQTSIDDSTLEIADEQGQDFDTRETQKDTSRKKVYPSQMESVSKTIKPETIASIKEDAKREILLNANKGTDAIVKSIKSEGKNLASKLAKDTGTFKKGWPNFVKDLVNEGLTKVIPAAALKRRFGSVLGIEQTGVVPTKKINPETGKVTNFNKPVYKVPKANDQNLIDYFTGQEKRKTSLLEVLGQDLVVEQMQELMTDQDFMSKLDTATDGKAVETMESLDQSLDTRQLEDTSLDTVKASKGKPFQVPTNGQNGIVTLRNNYKAFAKENNIDIEFEGEKINLDNLDAENLIHKKWFKNSIETELFKYIPLSFFNSANLASAGNRLDLVIQYKQFFTGKEREVILKKAKENLKKYEKENGPIYTKEQLKDADKAKAKEGFVKNPYEYGTSNYQDRINSTYRGEKIILQGMANAIKANPANALPIFALFSTQSSSSSHFVRQFAVARGVTGDFVNEKRPGKNTKEHVDPSNDVGPLMFEATLLDRVDDLIPILKKIYYQLGITKIQDDGLVDTSGQYGEAFTYKKVQTQEFIKILQNALDKNDASLISRYAPLLRYLNDLVNNNFIGGKVPFNTNTLYIDGVSVASELTFELPIELQTADIIIKQNQVSYKIITGEITKAQGIKDLKAFIPAGKGNAQAAGRNSSVFPGKVNKSMSIERQIQVLNNYDKTLKESRGSEIKTKGISVFDFDDTLAKTKEKVIVNKADGSVISISASEFAEQASELEEAGATFDFTNFENVSKGTQKGPLADLALRRQGKFGSKDIFVLTARPQTAATSIKTFLDGIGLNLPLENITGLENGSPQAKANWVISKTAKGYNDFYFADDAIGNVKAVAEILNQVDVKSKVQQAKASKGKVFKTVMNDIVQGKTGIDKYKDYSSARAQTVGKGKGTFGVFIPPSAEDFKGLLYKLLGKGKVGDAQFQFFKDNLIDPYNRAENALIEAKMTVARDFKALKNSLKTLPKSLSKLTNIGKFTFSQAVRVAAWTRQGMTVPGLSKRDMKELNDFVAKNPELNTLVDELIKIQKGKPYPKPGKNWLSGNITSDIVNEINTVSRKEYMQEFNENIDIMFDDAMFNKLEAAYGPNYVEALKDSIRRMKSGSNRAQGGGRIVDSMLDWLNNSVGAVMFLNTRSGLLQMLSAVNFINFGNNNLYKAGKAFLNQKQYWGDFMKLLNSDYLTERRNGLKINVSESEIADAVKDSKNKPKAAIAYLLSKGFIFTRIADSFAIAAGGSTFYRNQVEAYVKEGMSQKDAEAKAFEDFRAVAEETQQSSNPSKISQQQASGIGRVVLAFANTPMQYARIIKRSGQDLINGRGDWRANVSKIVYYSTVQNLIFNALQQALFALAFDEDEDDEKMKGKTGRIANGMADSLLRGMGYGGAMVSTMKNVLLKIAEENDKKSPKYALAVDELLSFSPPLDSKLRKLKSAANTFSWNGKDMKEKGFNLNNPAYLSVAQVVSATTNIPLDRAIQKINNLRAVASNSSENWQKVAMLLGWSTWDVGLPYYGVDDKVKMTPQMILREKVDVMKKETSTKDQKQMLLDLGLTKEQIKKLQYEEARVKKIIELQNKK